MTELRANLGGIFRVEFIARALVGLVLLAVDVRVAVAGLLAAAVSGVLVAVCRRAPINGLVVFFGLNWSLYFLGAIAVFGWKAGFYQQAGFLVFVVFLFGHLSLRTRIRLAATPLLLTPVLVGWLARHEPMIALRDSTQLLLTLANTVVSILINGAILIHFVRGLILQKEQKAAVAANRQRVIEGLSHELKTPLAAMLTQTQVALREEGLPERSEKVLTLIERNLRGMTRLTSRMLELARWEGGDVPVERQRVAVANLLRESVELHEPIAAQRGVKLVWRADREVTWDTDATLLRVALDNLVGNAIRHSPRDGRVEVEAGGSIASPDDDGAGAWIAVRDQGEGIAPEHLPRLFEAFFRGDPSRSREGGAHGLGLTIAARVVQSLGGRLEVESEQGRGSKFFIRL